MSEAPAASRSRPAATVHVPPSARTTLSWAASRVTDGVVVTKRSGQAETALISRGRASCRAGPTGVTPIGRIRAKTNQVRIGDPATGTQIREQSESNFCADRRTRPSGLSFRRSPFLSRPAEKRTTVRLRAQSTSESATCRIANRHRALSHAAGLASSLVAETLPSPRASLPQCGTWAKGPGTNGARIGDAALRRAHDSRGREKVPTGNPADAWLAAESTNPWPRQRRS